MFCRFGFVLLRRPVAAAAWLKVVWTRPSAIGELRQRLEVGGVQLVELAPREQRVDDRVLVAELLEHARIGRELALRRLLAGLQTELAVEHLAQLRRRVQVELPSGALVDLGLARRHPVADPLAHLVEVGAVEPDATRLHPRQHRGQRQLDVGQ